MDLNLESRHLYPLHRQRTVAPWRRAPQMSGDRPVRICTLGRFTVQSGNDWLPRSRSAHRRPMDLLQALIALGGRGVHQDLLIQAIWPDAEGDHAHNAFDVTLHRLRRLFDIPDLLVLRDCHLSLNSTLAWVDVWAFEQLVNHSARLLDNIAQPAAARQLARCDEQLLNLYQGPFLEREACQPWSLTLRERLRSKLLRYVMDAGQMWESRGESAMALRLYRKGLEVEPLAESVYQRLMLCLHACGRTGDALAVFQRCQQVLARQFQIPPSQATLAVYERLKSAL